MKKTFKRLGAIFLAMVMAVSVLCTGGALAADELYQITINGKSTGHTYEAYQVFTGDVATVKESTEDTKAEYSLSNIQWGSAIDGESFLKALKEDSELSTDFSGCTTAADVANVLSTKDDYKGHDAAKTQKFASVVEKNLKANAKCTTFREASSTENDDVVVYSAFVPAGYYLIKDKDGSQNNQTGTAATRFILEVVGPQTVESKDSVPTIIKKVKENASYTDDNGKLKDDGYGAGYNDTADYNINDEVPFELIGQIPDTQYYSTYTYKITDTLANGFTHNTVSIYLSDDMTGDSRDTDVLDKFDVGIEGQQLTITAKNFKNDFGNASGKYIIVKYTAQLNAGARLGQQTPENTNEVFLTYSSDPNNANATSNTVTDKVVVFTYELDPTKIDGTNSNGLKGAEFKLKNSKDKFVTVDDSSKVTGWANDQKSGSVLTSGDKGLFKVIGLDAGTYTLVETKAPEGYADLTNKEIPITITADTSNGQNGAGAATELKSLAISTTADPTIAVPDTQSDLANGIVKLTIKNYKPSELPSTGGMGTKLFYVIGGLLMAGAVIVLVIKKRRSSAE